MDNYYGGKKIESAWHYIIDGLLVNNEDLFFNALFKAMTNHPNYVLLSDMESSRKNIILNAMLKYFEDREDYEKCSLLCDIKKQIEYTC